MKVIARVSILLSSSISAEDRTTSMQAAITTLSTLMVLFLWKILK